MIIEFSNNDNFVTFDELKIGNYFINKDDTRLVVYEKTEDDKYFVVGEAGRGYFKISKEGNPKLIHVEIEKIIIQKV